jgi:hypothetical protein
MPTRSAALRDLRSERLATQQSGVGSSPEFHQRASVIERTIADRKSTAQLTDVRSAGG